MPLSTTEFGPINQPEHVLDTRIIKRNGIEIQQILIQWESFDASEASWEDLTAIKQSYPRFNLEDKVDFKGKGIVTSNSVGDKCVGNSIKNDGHMEGDPQNLATRRSTRAHKENVHFRGYDHGGKACCWYDSLSCAPIFFLSSSLSLTPSFNSDYSFSP